MSHVNDCQCTGPGWCERHQVNKTAAWVRLCQTNQRYWIAWEEGRGPGQKNKPISTRRPSPPPGPGTELRKMLGCGCCSYVAKMNKLGPDGCLKHLDELVGIVVASVQKREQSISENAARRMITLAVERSRTGCRATG
jgi:hypothetical protein